MTLQLLAVAATPMVRLWPHHPAPPELLALDELVVIQVLAVTLFWQLVDRWSLVAGMIGTTALFDQIAAIQSMTPIADAIRATVAVTIWTCAIRVTNGPSILRKRAVSAVLLIWVILPTLLNLGNFDRLSGTNDALRQKTDAGPVEICLGQIDRFQTTNCLWLAIPSLIICGAVRITNAILPRLRRTPLLPKIEP